MEKFKYQVEKEELITPISLKTFEKEGYGPTSGVKLAESFMEKLNNLKRVKFAVEESDSKIEIFIEENSLAEE